MGFGAARLNPSYEDANFQIHLSNSPREQCSATRFNWVPGHPAVSSFRFPKGEGGAPPRAEKSFMAPFGAPTAALVKFSEEKLTTPRELSELRTGSPRIVTWLPINSTSADRS